jgi:hypothetical protein
MIKRLTLKYRKYITEFLVIVLGVSVSFMAEQGRQSLNELFEAKELMEKAMEETNTFLEVDSFKISFKARSFIQDMINGKPFKPDSMHLVLAIGTGINFDINHYFPSLLALAKRTDLWDDPLAAVNRATSILRQYGAGEELNKKLTERLKTLYFKYGIMDDFMRLENVQLEKSRKAREVVFWNPLAYNLSYAGQYEEFVKDQEVINILKEINLNLVEQELASIDLENLRNQVRSTLN